MFSSLQSLASRYGFSSADRTMFRVQFLLLLAMCVALGISYDAQLAWRQYAAAHRLQLMLGGWDAIAWFTWLVAAPVILVLVRKFPVNLKQMHRNLVCLGIGSLVVYFIVTNVRFGLRLLFHWWFPSSQELQADWPTYLNTTLLLLPIDVLTFCGFLAVSYAVDYYFQSRRHVHVAMQLQLKAAQLTSDLSQAELAILRNQLHPHFLFNSFNAVATLVRQKKNEAAVEIIAQLSALLRRALERTGQSTVSLENELDFIRRYLEIEKVRFGEKLRCDFLIEPASLAALVPNLVLQPLVENAVKHGISQRTSPGVVSIIARRWHDRLMIEIANDGPDGPVTERRANHRNSSGIGLSNTRLRLEKLYGTDYRFDVAVRHEGGWCVHLDLPWQAAQVPTLSP
jgi:two-component system LytT family sensor kinase